MTLIGEGGEPVKVELTDREIATILASLRNWQIDGLNEDLGDAFCGHFEERAPLSDDEIDELCERINDAGERQVITKAAP
jgi:hypothetical protein